MRPPSILMSAGEISGDIAGAQVASAILRRSPDARLYGLGGRLMAEAGVAIADSGTHIGIVGLSEALAVMPQVGRAAAAVRRQVRRQRPDAALLIGNDLFNGMLARWLRRQGVRTIGYFPPQVWVWRSVLRLIGGGLTHVLASFPEEARAYASIGVPTTFVGHYLAESLLPVTADERLGARRTLDLPIDAPIVALLPGSRAHEIRRLAATMCAAARELERRTPPVRAVVAVADGFRSALDDVIRASGCGARMVPGTRTALRAADVALCCSGTATLEAALLGVPMAVAYRTSWLTYWLLRAGISAGIFESGTIALPNLLLRRTTVPELKQADADPEHLAAAAAGLLDDTSRRDAMQAVLGEVRAQVAAGPTIQTVADLVIAEAAA